MLNPKYCNKAANSLGMPSFTLNECICVTNTHMTVSALTFTIHLAKQILIKEEGLEDECTSEHSVSRDFSN